MYSFSSVTFVRVCIYCKNLTVSKQNCNSFQVFACMCCVRNECLKSVGYSYGIHEMDTCAWKWVRYKNRRKTSFRNSFKTTTAFRDGLSAISGHRVYTVVATDHTVSMRLIPPPVSIISECDRFSAACRTPSWCYLPSERVYANPATEINLWVENKVVIL